MLEILVAGLITIVLIVMAKRRRRSMGRYIKGNIEEDISLGTLGAETIISAASDTVQDRAILTSIDATWSLANYTPAANDGPIMVGVAHSDYSDTEVEQFLELDTSWAEGDKVDREVMNRLIRRIGVFDTPSDAAASVTLNDGKPIKTKLNWILNTNQGVNYWVYNTGSGALGTTDPVVHIEGHANIFPK